MKHTTTALSNADASELSWYFRNGGPCMFRYSNMGAQLALVERYAWGAEPCERCGGSIEHDRGGSGIVPSDSKRYARLVEAERKHWAAMGLEPPTDYPPPILDIESVDTRRMVKGKSEQHADGEKAQGWRPNEDYLGKRCPKCNGTGWRPVSLRASPTTTPPQTNDLERFEEWASRQITAWPTGSSKHGKAADVSIDEVSAARVGVTGRRLARLAALDPRAVIVLDAYLGEEGDQLIPLYSLTPAGHKLLRRVKNKSLSDVQAIETELMAEDRAPDERRRALLDACKRQARELLDESVKLWNRVVHPEWGDDDAEVAEQRAEALRRLLAAAEAQNLTAAARVMREAGAA